MADLQVKIDKEDFKKLDRRLAELLHDVLHLEPVMAEAAEYMKRSTVNRILRSKTSPEVSDGKRFET